MTQKVLKVGTSAAVTIPKESLARLGLQIGDLVDVVVDNERLLVSVRPVESKNVHRDKIAALTYSFINRYRKDLQALSQK